MTLVTELAAQRTKLSKHYVSMVVGEWCCPRFDSNIVKFEPVLGYSGQDLLGFTAPPQDRLPK